MGMNVNVNFLRARGPLRMPEDVKNEEDLRMRLEYKPQELTAEEVKEEAENMQPKTPTRTPSEEDLAKIESLINMSTS